MATEARRRIGSATAIVARHTRRLTHGLRASGFEPVSRLGDEQLKVPIRWLVVTTVYLATHGVLVVTAGEASGPNKRLKIVVFGGHPDDPESGAGGLVAMLTRQGHEVICAYGTTFRGDRQFFGRSEGEVRREEATAACKVLGARPKFFPYAHEKLVADEATVKEVAAWLAQVKPDIVVTHWPLDSHPNHHVVSSLVWQCYSDRVAGAFIFSRS